MISPTERVLLAAARQLHGTPARARRELDQSRRYTRIRAQRQVHIRPANVPTHCGHTARCGQSTFVSALPCGSMAVMTGHTIGHSTREHAELFAMLRRNGVTLLCDIRSYPSLKFSPQWNRPAVVDALPADTAYTHLRALAGKRKAPPVGESINRAWRNPSFRGYADYRQTAAFEIGLVELLDRRRADRNDHVRGGGAVALPHRSRRRTPISGEIPACRAQVDPATDHGRGLRAKQGPGLAAVARQACRLQITCRLVLRRASRSCVFLDRWA